MRQTISGLVAAIAIMTASAAPAMACGGGWFAPCGGYVAAPVYWGCNFGCGGWAYERLPDPVQQYYYVDLGPTYTGPGNFAPYPVYREGTVSGWVRMAIAMAARIIPAYIMAIARTRVAITDRQ